MKARFSMIVLMLLLTVPVVYAQQAPGADFDEYVNKAIKDWGVPGVAIAIVKDDRIVFAKGFGVRELNKPAPVDEHTLLAIGSSSKAFTAASLAMLVDEGKLKWDDPATKHLPGFQVFDPYSTRELNVADLISHRSGLARGDLLWYASAYDRIEVLRALRASRDAELPIIVMTAFGSASTAIEAMKLGAYDYLTKPYRIGELSALVTAAAEKQQLKVDNQRLRATVARLKRGPVEWLTIPAEDGAYDEAEAVKIMDAWWPRWMRAQFEPVFGKTLFDQIRADTTWAATLPAFVNDRLFLDAASPDDLGDPEHLRVPGRPEQPAEPQGLSDGSRGPVPA